MNGYTQVNSLNTTQRSSTAWAPLLAAIPHLWLAASIAASLLGWDYFKRLSPTALQTFGNVMMAGILATSLGVLLYAQFHDKPLWASAWSGYAILLGAVTLASLLLLLAPENELLRLSMIALSYLSVAAGYFIRFRRARLQALLLSLVLLVEAPLIFLDNITHLTEAIFVLILGVMAAVIAVVTVIIQNWRLSLLLVVVANLLAVFLLAFILTYLLVSPELYPDNTRYTLSLLWTGTLMVLALYPGTWLFWSAYDRLKRRPV